MSIELGKSEELEKVPSQEEVNEELEKAKDLSQKPEEEELDFPSLYTYKDVIINFEKSKAISLDMIFDTKYSSYGLCATSLSHKDDNDKPKSLRMNAVEELVAYLITEFDSLKDKVVFINDIKEISCFEELYPEAKVFEDAKKHRKVVVTFENDDIEKIYVYKMTTNFVFKKSLISIKNTIDSNKNEMVMKSFIQNFMMNMSAMNQQKPNRTPGGIIRP